MLGNLQGNRRLDDRERDQRTTSSLVQADTKPTVAQIITFSICAELKSISKCIMCGEDSILSAFGGLSHSTTGCPTPPPQPVHPPPPPPPRQASKAHTALQGTKMSKCSSRHWQAGLRNNQTYLFNSFPPHLFLLKHQMESCSRQSYGVEVLMERL